MRLLFYLFLNLNYIFKRSDGSIKPFLAELFYTIEGSDQIRLLGRSMQIYKPLSKIIKWATPQESKNLLTHINSFPNCYVVTREYGKVLLIIYIYYNTENI